MPPAPSLSRALGRLRSAARRAGPGRAPGGRSAPRRPDCPWCGSGHLRPWPAPPGVPGPVPPRARAARHPGPAPALPAVRPPRSRPGPAPNFSAFETPVPFDTCADCGHVFRNPGPALVDLAARPGGEGLLSRRRTARRHRSAARALLPFPEPESWLDVGTGDGDFPAVAREFFPYTAFDGVDGGHGVVRAQAAERVEEAHVGRLTDPHLTARLRARYDVVSMLHHLERTPDPRAELRAALTALRPGGHLLLDITGPHTARWAPPVRPAAPHLPPRATVEAELRAHGCTTVTATGPRTPFSTAYRVLVRRG